MLLVQYEPSVVITLASGVHRKFALTRMNVITSIMIVQPAALRYTPDIIIMQVKVSAPLPDRARALGVFPYHTELFSSLRHGFSLPNRPWIYCTGCMAPIARPAPRATSSTGQAIYRAPNSDGVPHPRLNHPKRCKSRHAQIISAECEAMGDLGIRVESKGGYGFVFRLARLGPGAQTLSFHMLPCAITKQVTSWAESDRAALLALARPGAGNLRPHRHHEPGQAHPRR